MELKPSPKRMSDYCFVEKKHYAKLESLLNEAVEALESLDSYLNWRADDLIGDDCRSKLFFS